MLNMLYLRQHAEIGLDDLKVSISTSKTKKKMKRRYSMEFAVRRIV